MDLGFIFSVCVLAVLLCLVYLYIKRLSRDRARQKMQSLKVGELSQIEYKVLHNKAEKPLLDSNLFMVFIVALTVAYMIMSAYAYATSWERDFSIVSTKIEHVDLDPTSDEVVIITTIKNESSKSFSTVNVRLKLERSAVSSEVVGYATGQAKDIKPGETFTVSLTPSYKGEFSVHINYAPDFEIKTTLAR